MIKNLIVGAVLFGLYKFLKKKWTDTTEYKVGLIDDQGNSIIDPKATKTIDQQDADTRLSKFSVSVKRLLDSTPSLKLKFMKTVLNSIMMREAAQVQIVRINDTIAIGFNELNESTNTQTFYTENGPIEVDSNTILEDEITNVTGDIAINPTPIKFIRRNDQSCPVIAAISRKIRNRTTRKARRSSDD
jgi:hypothetical protein